MRMEAVPLGDYVPGNSIVHRLSAGAKFLVLLVFIIATTVLAKTIPTASAALVTAALVLAATRVPAKNMWNQLWPPLPILIPLAAFQWWQKGFHEAAVVFLTVYACIIAAVVLTLTTPVAEMMDALEKAMAPLERFGFPAQNVSLAMSLTIRLLPLMFTTINEVLDARKARGAGTSMLAFGTPVIIRSLRRARAMGEALQARGVGG